LEQATQALFGLEQEIDGLARALAAREEQLAQEPAGESKAWLSEMLDQIFDLEVEERSRAQATSELLRSALARLHEAQGEATQNAQHQLCQRSTRLEENLRSLSQRLSSRLQKRWLAAANQLKEISTALRAGEMGEAQRLALDASSALMELERALEFESLFSSWHDPSTKASAEESARRVRALRQELDALRQQIWDATPQLSHHIEANEKAQLLREREEQERILRQTESIARKIQKFPLGDFGDEISQRLSEAGRDMEEAIESLGALDLPKAHRSQEEAARKLSEIREAIQQAQQMSQAEGEASSSGHRRFSREGVEIPRPEAFEAPMEWRRRVLEAMNGRTPEGFGDALRRYYESLLR
ncbi:MAG: hypothetical protein RMJ84_05960, partial [Sandaracinaceae bacterium]|nr:hypothetical protein [Sandaracinaceae bacterium]